MKTLLLWQPYVELHHAMKKATYVRTYVRTYERTYVRTYVRTDGRTDVLRTYIRTYVRNVIVSSVSCPCFCQNKIMVLLSRLLQFKLAAVEYSSLKIPWCPRFGVHGSTRSHSNFVPEVSAPRFRRGGAEVSLRRFRRGDFD